LDQMNQRRAAGEIVSAETEGRQAKGEPSMAPVPFVPRVVEVSPRHLTLFEFTDELCKYECTGRDDPRLFKFCGNPQVVGSYCAARARLCFIPKTDNKNLKAAA
jgi:hypothetical protein